VYGEQGLPDPCGEDAPARPTGDYGRSKAEAEKGLMKIAGRKDFRGRMEILRLAPVYDDRGWRLNLERRILLPGRMGYVRFGNDGKPSVMFGTLQDITELTRVKKELEETGNNYRTIADFTCDWEYWVDADGLLRYVSPACERITGYSGCPQHRFHSMRDTG